METNGTLAEQVVRLSDDRVLISGGGPVGLMVATVLAHYGLKSVVLERNESTTKWPKMDLTNVRSMELLGRLGLADQVRDIGVRSDCPYNVYMTTGLHNSKPITSWEYPCVEDLKKQYKDQNDGSSPREPWQRISQAVFEDFLKKRCDTNDLIDCQFGWKVTKTVESSSGVCVEAVQLGTNQTRTFYSRYLVACDGASSRVRRDLEIPLDGGPVPGYALLVHFKSKDLDKLFKFGHFWHLFIYNEMGLHAAAISQNDEDIFTTHLLLPLDADHEAIDSRDAVYRALGGMGPPFQIEIDEILVRSAYRHSIAVARTYRSALGRVYLAGDSAHQNIPTGGYGMNMGIGDAFDIGWKLAAVLNGFASPDILDSYEEERRPVALACTQQSGIHMEAHMAVREMMGPKPVVLESDSPEGDELRQKIHHHYQLHDGENTDIGIEMDIRHKSSIYPSPSPADGQEPPWSSASYSPSTYIGSRAPHVFLKDGSSVLDHLGPYWSLVVFPREEEGSPRSETLSEAAKAVGMPLKIIMLPDEENARKVWQAELVLVRADGHVVWRGQESPSVELATDIVNIATGRSRNMTTSASGNVDSVPAVFAATTAANSQTHDYKLEKMGAMQI